MKTLSTKGIILRRIDYGEADRIITFLTSDFGKTHAIAKGVRKAKSKMAGGIELFSVSELHYIKGKAGMDTLTSTRLGVHYGNIVKDLKLTELAYNMLKKIEKTVEDDTGHEYFSVLNESLAGLDSPAINHLLVELSFDMRVLQLLGQVPDFAVDSSGKRLDPESIYEFDYESMSFTQKPEGMFNKNHIKVLKLLSHNSPQSMAVVKGINSYCQDLSELIRTLANRHVG